VVTGYLGKSSITQMTESRGLSPGLSKQESSIIRFVTVAMAEYSKGHVIKVQGTASQLLFLASSILAMETKLAQQSKSGVTVAAILENMKKKVVASTLGLKMATAKSVGALFSIEGRADSYISWSPRRFSSGSTAADVVKENEEYYTFINTEASRCNRRAIFRQVLNEPKSGKEHLFTDGFPNLFNYWLTSYPDLQAMNQKNGAYALESLVPVTAPLYDFSFKRAQILLCSAFIPDMTRSYRIAAVVGGKVFSSITSVMVDSDSLASEVSEGIEESSAFAILAEAMGVVPPLEQIPSITSWTTSATTSVTQDTMLSDLTSQDAAVQIMGDDDD
jgi:hypothetical protein